MNVFLGILFGLLERETQGEEVVGGNARVPPKSTMLPLSEKKQKQETRPRLARKQNIASEVGPTLQDAFFFPTRSIREASARQHQARCSAQTGRCKLVCASCSTQVALCKLLCASCSAQVVQLALRKLLCASCFKMQVPARGPGRNRTRDPPVPGAGARTTRQLPRTSSNNKSRKKPRVFAPRPRRFPQRVARAPQKSQKTIGFLHLDHADPRQRVARAPQKSQKTMGVCTSTTPIPAEGRAGMLEIAKNHGFLHFDHADPRRGSREQVKHRKKPGVFAPRPRRSPQRVARAPQKSQKTMGFCTSTTPIPAEGRAGTLEIAKKPWVFAPRPRRSPQRVDFRVVLSALPRRPKKRF